MRDKHWAAMRSSNHTLVLQTQGLAPFGGDLERGGGNLSGGWGGGVSEKDVMRRGGG
jgi:hypothetical protein